MSKDTLKTQKLEHEAHTLTLTAPQHAKKRMGYRSVDVFCLRPSEEGPQPRMDENAVNLRASSRGCFLKKKDVFGWVVMHC